MLWELFVVFIKVGIISFGGGYAVIPVIHDEVIARSWMTDTEFQSIVSMAGMSPGPMATNSATLIGYHAAGWAGATVSTAGMILPSLAVILLLASVFYRFHRNPWLKSAFYGLRAIVTGMIAYAAIRFGFLGQAEMLLSWTTASMLLLCVGCLYAMLKYKLHPLTVILLSGAGGIILFT